MHRDMRWLSILLLTALQIAGLLIFCLGFFPSKVVLKGFGEFDNGNYDPQFSKVVFMVVDALRSDFVFSEGSSMKYVQSLLREGTALGFTAYSNPPTVTLPRLKGITTGSTPNFLDAILNVVEEDSSSTLAHQDSWITQLKRAGKTIHMYGDDTWIKLFPNVFDKSEGTSSFFVSDFTEVDNNVTRHIDHELKEQDWDCLILHYLGLDHIGHKGGPKSVFMPSKQREMDDIVQRIHKSLSQDTLMILIGDHGMNDVGNHGGSSAGETSAGLVFISDKLKKLGIKSDIPQPSNEDYKFLTKIQQIDLVPTISNLLHFPIPRNNLGIMIKQFLPLWNADHQLNLMKENLKNYESLKDEITNLQSVESIYEYLQDSQSGLIQSATNYDTKKMLIGLAIITFTTLLVSIYFLKALKFKTIYFIGLNALYGITMFGSSFVEEEYQIWWWFATLVLTILCFDKKLNLVVILALIRVVRGWNNTGQKFVGDTILQHLKDNHTISWALIFVTISAYAFSLNNGGLSIFSPLFSFMISFVIALTLFSFKLLFSLANGDTIPKELIKLAAFTIDTLGVTSAQDSLIDVARLFYVMVFAVILLRIALKFRGYHYWYFTDIHNLITLILIFQTSIYNIPLFLIFLGIKQQIGLVAGYATKTYKLEKIGFISLSCLILQHLSFFSLGESNSLATVDLSNAYNGISGYNIFAVGALTFISNFSTPLFWAFGSLSILFENKENFKIVKYEVLKMRWLVNSFFYTSSAAFTLTACYILRYHLFIWTVFSPKLLYTLAWNILINGVAEVVCLLLTLLF